MSRADKKYDLWMVGTEGRWSGAKVRFHAYKQDSHDEKDEYKCVIQAITPNGDPIAEDPLFVAYENMAGIDKWLSESKLQGWDIQKRKETWRMKLKRQ